MNLTVLLIAAYLPLPFILFMILRSGSFGKGSVGTLLKLFFLGAAVAVPAFLMEASCLFVIKMILGIFPEGAFGGNLPLVSAILRSLIAVALIQEGWRLFVLRKTTWKQMTMETLADGIAASAVVGAGFSMVMYGAWQAVFRLLPANLDAVRDAFPDFLHAGTVTAFIFALLFMFSIFGFSGLMGAFYGIAKREEQKDHGGRAGFMLFLSFLLPVLFHGLCAALIGYGIAEAKVLWLAIGLVLEVLMGFLMAAELGRTSDQASGEDQFGTGEKPVDFADSEEFASFAENSGKPDDPAETDDLTEPGASAEPDGLSEPDDPAQSDESSEPGSSM